MYFIIISSFQYKQAVWQKFHKKLYYIHWINMYNFRKLHLLQDRGFFSDASLQDFSGNQDFLPCEKKIILLELMGKVQNCKENFKC